jgi:hypothetical protein
LSRRDFPAIEPLKPPDLLGLETSEVSFYPVDDSPPFLSFIIISLAFSQPHVNLLAPRLPPCNRYL